MTTPTASSRRDTRNRPLFDEKTIVFTLNGHEDVAAFLHTNAATRSSTGLELVKKHVARHESRAALRGLFAERAHAVFGGAGQQFALPNLSSPKAALSAVHHLRLAAPAAGPELIEALLNDHRVTSAHFPAIHYPIEPTAGPLEDDDDDDETAPIWGVKRCRFHKVWDTLDGIDDTRPIGLIDAGRNNGNPVLNGRIDLKAPDGTVPGSQLPHASEVASVIAARRGVDAVFQMAGCCSAKLALYDVWNSEGEYDAQGYYDALKAVAAARLPVVNISVGSEVRDKTAEALIADAIADGVVFVAAVGNDFGVGNPKLFPAGYDGVIGVGATDFNDDRLESSCTGDHVYVSAPGWRILAVQDAHSCRKRFGTSFATAMVSAAVWLAKKKHPEWTTTEIKEALRGCANASKVKGGGARDDEVGFGRLDVQKLAALL